MSLINAALYGNLDEVDRQISMGVDVNQMGWALMAAAQEGHDSIVSRLISEGAEVNEKTDEGIAPLAMAALDGHVNIVKRLISEGAEVNQKDEFGETALHAAIEKGHDDIVEYLISKGANTDNIEFFCPRDYPYCKNSNNSCYKNKGKNGKFSSPRRWWDQDGCKYDYRMGLEEPSTSTSASNEDSYTPLMKAEYAGSGMDVRMDGGSLKSKRRKSKRRKTKRRNTKRRKTKRKTRKYK
tara:strand:+ start:488 stop:1204 length:717 start_codon:yes stop_codon:yes gene_type:complete